MRIVASTSEYSSGDRSCFFRVEPMKPLLNMSAGTFAKAFEVRHVPVCAGSVPNKKRFAWHDGLDSILR